MLQIPGRASARLGASYTQRESQPLCRATTRVHTTTPSGQEASARWSCRELHGYTVSG